MKTRLYAVTAILVAEARDYLVDAASVNTAKQHVAKKIIKAQFADGKTVAELMAKGVQPESAVNVAGNGQQGSIE